MNSPFVNDRISFDNIEVIKEIGSEAGVIGENPNLLSMLKSWLGLFSENKLAMFL